MPDRFAVSFRDRESKRLGKLAREALNFGARDSEFAHFSALPFHSALKPRRE